MRISSAIYSLAIVAASFKVLAVGGSIGTGTTISAVNGGSGSGGAVGNGGTNFSVASEVIVTASASLVTNYTAFSTLSLSAVSNSPNVFGPWRGASYVQAAVDALSYQPSTFTQSAGGKVLVLGMNYIPNTLVLSNHFEVQDASFDAESNVLNIAFESPDHKGNGFVCYGNPGILLAGQDSQAVGYGTMSPTFKNLIIASAVKGTNYLIYEQQSGIANQRWEDCYIAGSWWSVTNNEIFGIQLGLATPSDHANPWTNDSAIMFQNLDGDLCTFRGNHFCWLAGIIENCDHAELDDNFFMSDGFNRKKPTFSFTDWPTNSPFYAGGALIQIQTGAEAVMYHNNFYDCGAAYFCATLNGSTTNLYVKNSNFNWISYNDKYETTQWSVLYFQTNGVFEQVDPLATGGNVFSARFTNGTANYYGNTNIVVDTFQNGMVFTSDIITGINGNGSGLTNIPASSITSTSPKIPTAVTLTGSVFTFTNNTSGILECYFSGSVAYSTTKNGVGVFGSLVGDSYFLLQPTNRCAITYTVAPTFYTNSF